MRGPIFIRGFQLQHDIAGAVECEPFIGDGRAGDVATQLLELITLIHGAAHRGVEAEPLLVGTALPSRGRLKVGDRSQGDHFLTGTWSQGNAIGTSGRLQRRQSGIGLGVGQVRRALLFKELALACQSPQEALDDLVERGVQLLVGGRTHGVEHRPLVGGTIDPIEKEAMQVNIQIRGGSESLDEGHGAGFCLDVCQAGLLGQKGRDGAVDHS